MSDAPMNVLGEGKVFCQSSVCPIYTGPEYYAGLGTLVLTVTITALFNVFTAPYFVFTGVLAALVVEWAAQAIAIVSLVMLLTTDPGIVPRSVYYREQYDPIRGTYRDRPPPVVFENSIRTFPIRSKFCETCGSVRAPRVVHCSTDDVDMERFDHHCPWIGCCVGKRNYKIFLTFLFSMSVAVLGIIGISIAHLALTTLDTYDDGSSLSSSIRTSLNNNVAVAIVAGLCLLFMWFVVGLTGYHIYLSTHAMTTYEHIRGAFETLGNPYDKGRWYLNFWSVFSEPTRPSWVNLRTRGIAFGKPLDSELEPVTARPLPQTMVETASTDSARFVTPVISVVSSIRGD